MTQPTAAWLLGLALLTVPAAAAPGPCKSADSTRPSVGLVLSGGGARGAAHVGVLRVLEEMQIPIDCITGTSMRGGGRRLLRGRMVAR
jgi:NTE family protein